MAAASLFGASRTMESRASADNYSTLEHEFVLPFETSLHFQTAEEYANRYWTPILCCSAVYLGVVYLTQKAMRPRPSFNLRTPLIVWNWALAMFSLFGAIRMLPELIFVLSKYGVYHSVCVASYAESNLVCTFWTWAFGLSKLVELGDTVFIVLRKQPLIFLHWYHHVTVLLYTWYSIAEVTASGRWFVTLNYIVHTFMYTYYAMRAMRVRIPRRVAMGITCGQVIQMVFGLYVNLSAYKYKQSNMPCSVTYENLAASFFMYFTYFLLFVKFFYDAYVGRRGKFIKFAAPALTTNGSANGAERTETDTDANRRLKSE
ncbi:unnamed protein product [Notodromas monacha]|uniref:Elongation of very long chain fatty acids protein n=1 Tax=Notodromas monacha TaxID=399045 RepID=A0A7R9GCW1_9CRUS|nr:unnamed protein product [Notodromas monacha]CAG0917887.1 unnamed protein product [Notodromas monacha]